MVDCVIADETASSKAFFKGETAQLIQKGNVIAIRNGMKRFIKDHISLEIDLFGRVTLEKDIDINPKEDLNISDAEHKLDKTRRDNRRPQGGRREPRRDGDRPYRNNRDDRRDRDNGNNRNLNRR